MQKTPLWLAGIVSLGLMTAGVVVHAEDDEEPMQASGQPYPQNKPESAGGQAEKPKQEGTAAAGASGGDEKQAKAEEEKSDEDKAREGEPGKDHPMVVRYPDTEMKGFGHNPYDAFVTPLGPLTYNGEFSAYDWSEGEITFIRYSYPEGDLSSGAVMAYFEEGLKEKGFDVVYSCMNVGFPEMDCRDTGGTLSNGRFSTVLWSGAKTPWGPKQYYGNKDLRAITAALRKGSSVTTFVHLVVDPALKETAVYVFDPKSQSTALNFGG